MPRSAASGLQPPAFVLFAILYLSLGLAILAKGPVGFLLPMASLGLFMMIVNSRQSIELRKSSLPAADQETKRFAFWEPFRPSTILKSIWQLRPITGVVVILAVVLPWYILVGLRTDGLWLSQFFGKFNFRPFMQPILGHSGPMWYYIPVILIGFFPWSVFLGFAAIDTVRRIREGDPRRNSHLLLGCWFGVFFVFWSICSTKLPHYMLPAYPVLALMTGSFLETWIVHPARVGPSWMKNAWLTTIVVGVGIVVAVAIASHIYLPGEGWIGLVGLILVIGGHLCLYYAKQHERKRVVVVFACTSAAFLTAMFGLAELRVDRHQNAKHLLAAVHRESHEPTAICAYRFFRQSMVFYAGHPITYCDTPEQLQEFLEKSPEAYIITLDEHQAEIEHLQPGRVRVFAHERRFLAWDEMIVLSLDGKSESAETASKPCSINQQ